MSDLEQQLARLELRPVPAPWREEILRAAAQAQNVRAAQTGEVPWWRVLFWPAPRAWGALAGVWLLIALMYLTMPSADLPSTNRSVVASSVSVDAWREQQRLLAELFPREPHAEPPKVLPPRRRSDREREHYVA
jgi:hypothetical protein